MVQPFFFLLHCGDKLVSRKKSLWVVMKDSQVMYCGACGKIIMFSMCACSTSVKEAFLLAYLALRV